MLGDDPIDAPGERLLKGATARQVQHRIVIVCDAASHMKQRLQTMTKYEGAQLWETYSGTRRGVHIFPKGGMHWTPLREDEPVLSDPTRSRLSSSPDIAEVEKFVHESTQGVRYTLDIKCDKCADAIRFRQSSEFYALLDKLSEAGLCEVSITTLRDAQKRSRRNGGLA